jgi:two-component system sensor histidine kinase/response regulator
MDKATIFIIDDDPANLGIFLEYLEESGFEVSVARSGEGAIQQLTHFRPDLILLDVMMPGIDGFETCRRLKKNEKTRDIPVIFMTALSDPVDKVKGFLVGGVDYITKPLHHEEVLVRVTAHLTIQTLQRQIQAQNALLERKNAIIEEQKALLEEKNEQVKTLLAYKEKLFSFISSDLQHPLNKLLGFTRLIAKNINAYRKDEIKGQVDRLQTSAEELYALLENLLIWSAHQRGILEYVPEPIDVYEIAVYNMLLFTPNAEQKQIMLRSSIQEKVLVYADYNMVTTVIRNLLSNALKFTDSEGSVTISAEQTEDFVELSVSDTGIGISAENLPHLFEIKPTSQENGPAGNERTGLGLILCKELIEKNGGAIWCESEIGKGTTVRFTLPNYAK